MDISEKKSENQQRRAGKETGGKRLPRPQSAAVSVDPARRPGFPAGLHAYPFQLDAARFALARPRCYLALDPGLGKTIIAALIMNQLPDATAFYVCPPFLTSNTEAEFRKWCFVPRLYLLPDSRLAKPETLHDFFAAFREAPGRKVLFVDEAHRFKNEKAQRTRALFQKIYPRFSRVVFMSGTPLPNSRPVELWPVIRHACPDAFDRVGFFPFARRFCGAFKTPYGWDFSGFTNRKEFKERLTRSFMLRMKKDVLDLPPKREGLLTVGENLPAMVSNIERRILKHYSPEDVVQGKIGATDEHLATYLRLLGKHKLKYVIPYLESLLEETDENLLIFATHRAVIAGLAEALAEYRPLVITGETPVSLRQSLVSEFENNLDRRLFLGNIRACGVGFTINKASRVLFVEFSWTDGENVQAADRAHRIGQAKSILVQYVVLAGSIDRARMETLLRKRERTL